MDRGNTRTYEELLDELSGLCGIQSDYYDIFGERHFASSEAKKAAVTAMKVKTGSLDDLREEVSGRQGGAWTTLIEPVIVRSVNEQPLRLPVYIPVPPDEEGRLRMSVSLTDEQQHKEEYVIQGGGISVEEERWIEGRRYIRTTFTMEKVRGIGYYEITVDCSHPEHVLAGGKRSLNRRGRVIISPDSCYLQPELQMGRAWGLSLSLYGLRSARNWGVGNFSDLDALAGWVGRLGGSFVGINPLHAIPNERPFGISPYSPVSRLYRNSLYIDVEKIPEVKNSEKAAGILTSGSFKKKLERLRGGELVEYEETASLQEKVLRYAFAFFYERHYRPNTGRGKALRKYVSEEGAPLELFALYHALRDHMKKTYDASDWRDWPPEYHDPRGEAVKNFRSSHARKVLYYQYLQWIIEGQLRETSEKAGQRGMAMGIYQDLAVGADGGGSDVWSHQDTIASGIDVGAPPDDFSPNGQNWGFPPPVPGRMKETGYDLFIRTIRKNMQCSGAIRIDHVLGMFRLFWIPRGMTPGEGVYVRYPSEDLLRIIALESVRNRTAVIGEDLGTVGDNVRESLRRFGMLSYRLFYFERNYPDPSFVSPENYPEMALCSVATHDLPTLYGYWRGRDLEVRREQGVFDDAAFYRHMEERKRDKTLILSALKDRGLLPEGISEEADQVPEMTADLCTAVYRYLSLTPCKLVLVNLDDVIGAMDQQNMPGVFSEYPNWMRKIPLPLEDIMRDERFEKVASGLEAITESRV